MRKFLKNKKAQQLSWQKLIVHTLEILVILLVFLPLGKWILDLVIVKPEINSINNLERLDAEVEDIIIELRTSEISPAPRTIPLFIDPNWPIGLDNECQRRGPVIIRKGDSRDKKTTCMFLFKASEEGWVSSRFSKLDQNKIRFEGGSYIFREKEGISNIQLSVRKNKEAIFNVDYIVTLSGQGVASKYSPPEKQTQVTQLGEANIERGLDDSLYSVEEISYNLDVIITNKDKLDNEKLTQLSNKIKELSQKADKLK